MLIFQHATLNWKDFWTTMSPFFLSSVVWRSCFLGGGEIWHWNWTAWGKCSLHVFTCKSLGEDPDFCPKMCCLCAMRTAGRHHDSTLRWTVVHLLWCSVAIDFFWVCFRGVYLLVSEARRCLIRMTKFFWSSKAKMNAVEVLYLYTLTSGKTVESFFSNNFNWW